MPGSSSYKFRIAGRYVKGSTVPSTGNYNLGWNTSGYWEAKVDTTVPVLALATVQAADMVLLFDEQLDTASVPAVTAFSVVTGGVANAVTAVSLSGNVVRLTLTTAAFSGQTVTVAYTVPGSNMLQDLAGNDVATFGATTALNYSRDWNNLYQAADQPLTSNTTTYQDSNTLQFVLLANKSYAFRLYLRYNCSAVADIKLQWSLPAGASYMMHGTGYDTGGALVVFDAVTASQAFGGTGANIDLVLEGVIINGANSDAAILQAAQNTAEATNITILGGSYLSARLLN